MKSAFSAVSCRAVASVIGQDTRYIHHMTSDRDARATNEDAQMNRNNTHNEEENNNNGNSQVKDKCEITENEQNDEFATNGPLLTYEKKTGPDTPSSSCFSQQQDRDGEDPLDDDVEVSYFLKSVSNRDGCSGSDKVAVETIEVNENRKDEDHATVHKPKRVTLESIAAQSSESIKRQKIGETQYILLRGTPITSLPVSQDLSDKECISRFPSGIPLTLIYSSDDEALHENLCEELATHGEGADISRSSTPVALLTPPQSPLTIEVDGVQTTICEWPSNLAVDSAITAAINEIRPMSPESLQRFEQVEESRVANLVRNDTSSEAN